MDARLVIGLGNPMRRDDGAGHAVVRAIQASAPGVPVRLAGGDGAALLEAWKDAAVVVVVDAVRSGAAPGTVHRFDATVTALPRSLSSTSTHVFGLPDAVELARTLGTLPGRLIVYGIEGAEFAAGEGLSAPVQEAVPRVAARILEEMERRDA